MIFHENRLLADDSNEISYLLCFRKLEKMSQKLSSAVVTIGTLRVKKAQMLKNPDRLYSLLPALIFFCFFLSKQHTTC